MSPDTTIQEYIIPSTIDSADYCTFPTNSRIYTSRRLLYTSLYYHLGWWMVDSVRLFSFPLQRRIVNFAEFVEERFVRSYPHQPPFGVPHFLGLPTYVVLPDRFRIYLLFTPLLGCILSIRNPTQPSFPQLLSPGNQFGNSWVSIPTNSNQNPTQSHPSILPERHLVDASLSWSNLNRLIILHGDSCCNRTSSPSITTSTTINASMVDCRFRTTMSPIAASCCPSIQSQWNSTTPQPIQLTCFDSRLEICRLLGFFPCTTYLSSKPTQILHLPRPCDSSSLVESLMRSPLLEPTLSWIDYQLVDCWICTAAPSYPSISTFAIHNYSSKLWITYHRRFHLALRKHLLPSRILCGDYFYQPLMKLRNILSPLSCLRGATTSQAGNTINPTPSSLRCSSPPQTQKG